MCDYGPDTQQWEMQRGHYQSWPREEIDWASTDIPLTQPVPHNHRHWNQSHRPSYSAYSAPRSSVAASRQRLNVTRAASVLLSSPAGTRDHSSDQPLRTRPPVAPYLVRASATPSEVAAALPYYNQQPQPDLSHRNVGPPLAADHFRSTTHSRRSAGSSPSDSDGDTESTRPTPAGDDGDDEYEYSTSDREASRSFYEDSHARRDRRNSRRLLSQKQALSSPKPLSTRQNQSQMGLGKQKGIYPHSRDSGLDSDSNEENKKKGTRTSHQEGIPRRRGQYRDHSRRSSGSCGSSDVISKRGRSHGSKSHKEATGKPAADAHSETDSDDLGDDRQRRREASRHTRRSISRHTAAANDRRRDMSRSKSRLRVETSGDFNPRASFRRPNERHERSELSDRYANHSAAVRSAKASSSNASSKRPSSLFESPVGFEVHALSTEKSKKRYYCFECTEEFHLPRLAKLDCGHLLCTSCLKRKYKISLSDPRFMPPQCCTKDAIAPKHAEKLFDSKFKQLWNRQYCEVSIGRRIYCPSRRCGQWIKPENMYRGEDGRELAVCSACRTKVCCSCNGKFHRSPKCPYNEELLQHLDQIRGRQNCYNCKSLVEHEAGRSHIFCQCGAESCAICGQNWSQCECPTFDLDTDTPRRNPAQYTRLPRFERFGSAPSITVKDLRASNVGNSRAYPASEVAQQRPKSYEGNVHLQSYRTEHQHDDYRSEAYRDDDHDLAQRMHAFGRLGEGDEGQELSNRLTGEHMSRFAQRHDKTDNANIRARLPRTSRDLGDLDDDDYGYHGRAVSEFLPSVPHPPSAPPSPPYLQPEPSANSQRDQQNQNLLPRLLRSQHVPYYEPHQKSSKRGQYSRQPPPSFRRADPSYEDDWPIAPSEFHVNGISRTRATVVDSPESTVGRLAGRFNSDTRSSPLHRPMAQLTPGLGGGMAGVLAGPLSPSGSMPRMSPHSTMPLPTAQPKIATIPIASVVPRIPELPAMRRYGVDMDPYMSRQPLQRGRSFEQDPIAETTRGAARYEETGKLKFGPGGLHSSRQQSHRSRSRPMESSARRTSKVPQSELAGLTGPGSGMDRVREWREYIGDESSDQDSASDTE